MSSHKPLSIRWPYQGDCPFNLCNDVKWPGICVRMSSVHLMSWPVTVHLTDDILTSESPALSHSAVHFTSLHNSLSICCLFLNHWPLDVPPQLTVHLTILPKSLSIWQTHGDILTLELKQRPSQSLSTWHPYTSQFMFLDKLLPTWCS